MIEFEREATKVKAKVATNIGFTYHFNWECESNGYAILLRDHIQEKMARKLEGIRREAYEQGWNDHKKRKTKATWFKGFW